MLAFPDPRIPPSELVAQLSPGESVLWWGKPQPEARINGFSLAFGLGVMLLGLSMLSTALFTAVMQHSLFSNAASLLACIASVPLLALGWVGISGAFTTAGYLARTSYAITATRVIKCIAPGRGSSPPKVSAAPIASLAKCTPMKSTSGWQSVLLQFVMTEDTVLEADPVLFGGGPNPTYSWWMGGWGKGKSGTLPADSQTARSVFQRTGPAFFQYARITLSNLASIQPVLTLLGEDAHQTTWVP